MSSNVDENNYDVNDELNRQDENVAEDCGVSAELVLMPKKNSTAVIWKFFGFEASDDQAVNDPTCISVTTRNELQNRSNQRVSAEQGYECHVIK
jgi:hypothetical protein